MNSKSVVIELGAQTVLALNQGKGARVNCLQGCLWLTEEADRRDIVLEAGQSHVLAGPGRTVIQAIADSRLSVGAAVTLSRFAHPEGRAVQAQLG